MNKRIITRKQLLTAIRATLDDIGKRLDNNTVSAEFYQGAQIAIERLKHELEYDKLID